MSKTKLDKLIAHKAYELDCLMAYRNIIKTGSCNECKNKYCEYMPKIGQMVRYNCPFYEKVESENKK